MENNFVKYMFLVTVVYLLYNISSLLSDIRDDIRVYVKTNECQDTPL